MHFRVTKNSLDGITDLFDFATPTIVALWNLRWQVKGYMVVQPDATTSDLNHRFVHGSGQGSTNLKRACINHDWEYQREQFASIILINVVAQYESWIDGILNALQKKNVENTKGLQFPTSPNGQKGILATIRKLNHPRSDFIEKALYSEISGNKKYCISIIDNLLYCYRFFKELRNSVVHNGWKAGQNTVVAYTDFKRVATSSLLLIKEVPKHYPVVLNNRIKIDLRGVIGFSDVVIRMMYTIDAELCRGKAAEKEFIDKWKAAHKSRRTLAAAGSNRRRTQISVYIHRAGFPYPDLTHFDDICEFLLQHRLVGI